MTKELLDAIQKALDQGFRVELIKLKSGEIQVNTVSRKLLKKLPNPRPERRAGRTERGQLLQILQ